MRLAILLGVAADSVVGDPRRGHPVAAFGRWSTRLQGRTERDSRAAGALHLGLCLVVTAGLSRRLERALPPSGRLVLGAAATWAALGGTKLGREARAIAAPLAAGDLDEARRRLPALVGRDPAGLDAVGIARAVVESVAENTNDAVVAPLLWGAALGVPGVVAFRVVNTLDAMVGHRSERYERFGWASARLDDVLGLVPARVTAALAVALAPLVGGTPRRAFRVWQADARHHPSPNAGPVEAAFAGALDVALGGPVTYPYGTQDRPWLHLSGQDVTVADVDRAVRLSRLVAATAVVLAVAATR